MTEPAPLPPPELRRAPSRVVVLAILRRELGAQLGQPAAWVFLSAFLAVAALLGLRGFFERNVADLRDAFAGLRWAFVLLAPAAAMRLWSEERRAGTDLLLLTLPVRPWEAVLGKYLSGLVLVALGLALTAVLPLSLAPFAAFDPGQVAAGALGALLLGAAFLAVGLLASAVAPSQEVAFLLGAGGCLLLNLLGDPLLIEQATRLLPSGLWSATLGNLAVGLHYEALTRGVLDTRAAVAFLAVTAAALLLAVLAIERREPGRRVGLTAGLIVAALLLALDLAGQRPLQVRLDLTTRRANSLAPATTDLLARARGRLTLRAYLSEGIPEATRPLARRLLDLLHELEAAGGGRVTVEVVDPRTPDLQQAAERQGVQRFQLQVAEGDGASIRTVYAGVVVFYGGRPPAAVPVALDPNLDLEVELALALRRVLLPRRVIAFAGQGLDGYAKARAHLARSHEVRTLDLSREKQVPQEVALVIYAAPGPPPERELYVLDQHLARGGRVVLLVEGHGRPDPREPWLLEPHEGEDATALARTLAAWGVAVGPGLVVQEPHRAWPLRVDGGQVQALYPWFVTPRPAPAEGRGDRLGVGAALGHAVLPFASEVRLRSPAAASAQVAPLAVTEPAWTLEGAQSTHPSRRVGHDLGDRPRAVRLLAAGVRGRLPSAWRDRPGPVLLPAAGGGDDPLAVPLREPLDEARVAVVGDCEFARDPWLQLGPGGVALLEGLVEWALGEAQLATVHTRRAAPALSGTDATWLGVPAPSAVWAFDLVGLPTLVLALGLGGLVLRARGRERAASRRRQEGAP